MVGIGVIPLFGVGVRYLIGVTGYIDVWYLSHVNTNSIFSTDHNQAT